MLNQARRADETEGTSGSADSGVNGSGIFYFIRYKNIADTFARQRQRFTVGVADQRVFIIFGQIRNFHVPIDEFAVRFIGNQIDRMAVGSGFFFQKSDKLTDTFLRINNTGRIVRGVDEDTFCVLIDRSGKPVKVDLEGVRVGRSLCHFCTSGLNENAVFREIRSEDHIFITRKGQCAKDNAEGSGSTAGHVKVIGAKRSAKAFIQVRCNGSAGVGISLCGSVTEQIVVIPGIKQFFDCLMNGSRSRDVWISDAEIENIFRTDFGGTFFTVFKDFTDDRFFGTKSYHFF